MSVAQAGLPYPFDYTTFDFVTTLSIRATVWDVTDSTPAIYTQVTMGHVSNGMYAAKFAPLAGRSYVVHKLVYTDGTYSVLDSSRAAGTECVQGLDMEVDVQAIAAALASSAAADIYGYVEDDFELVGVVECVED